MKTIAGVGMTRFGHDPRPESVLAHEAAREALDDAGLSFQDIDAVVCTSQQWSFAAERHRHFSSQLASVFKTTKPIVHVPAACGGGGAALWHASRLGYGKVLVVGVERLSDGSTASHADEFMMAAEPRYEQDEGVIFPAQNALVAQEYLRRYPDTTMDHLALIAHKNHEHATMNPKAKFFQRPVSLETIRASPVVASPLRLHDCSISVDGAAAAVLTDGEGGIELAGIDLRTDTSAIFEKKDMTRWDATVESSQNALRMAGMGPRDIDIAELHDAFTMYELLAYEDIGFAPRGGSWKLIEDGHFGRDGKLPVNVSGGLKARGHPLSATGLAQVYELVRQLRSEAGGRQIDDVRTALAHNVGGSGGTVTTTVLRKR